MTETTAAPRSVPLWQVERELLRQMKELQGPDERPVQRAHMANLVVYCDSQERAAELNREIPEVVSVHPARVLLLIADAEIAEHGVGDDRAGSTAANRLARLRLFRAGDADGRWPRACTIYRSPCVPC